jgi:flagellar motor switch protein FliM
MESPLELSVEMGNANITLRELLELAPGDTIMLDKSCSSELQIKIEGTPKYLGVPGLRHGNRAIQITEIDGQRGNS